MELNLIGITSDYKGIFPIHKHNVWEIVIFIEGSGVHRIGASEFKVKAGSIICQPPNISHSTVADTSCTDLYIQIKNFVPPMGMSIKVIEDDEDHRLWSLAMLMHTTFYLKEENYKELLSSLLDSFYQLLIIRTGSVKKDDYIKIAVKTIIANFLNPLFTTEELVKNSHYCSDHFRRKFKKGTGMTPASYLIMMRLNHAKKMLLQRESSGLSIKNIALLSGFSDQYYFSKLFKSREGISPRSYKIGKLL